MKAVWRLFVAIVNQAILDLLQAGRGSRRALVLSRDFGELQSVFGEQFFGSALPER